MTTTNSKILVDVGSSTLKAFIQTGETLKPLVQRSIPLKENFDPESGFSEANKKELLEFFDALKDEYKDTPIKAYATAMFRKLSLKARRAIVDEIFIRSGIYLNVISQELENFYLEMGLVGKSDIKEPVLLINAGGGSTELVVMFGKEAVERLNVDLGVGTILTKFTNINEKLSGVALDYVVNFVKEQLPALENKPKIAFYTGGELTYMQLANYPLVENKLFKDVEHPSTISCKDFAEKNRKLFERVTLEELEALMPENPKWMHGARACSALSQAICEKYGIETVIPSNANLVHGIANQEFRYVTISGSFRKHLDYIVKVKQEIEAKGAKVLSPRFTAPKNPGEEFVVFQGEEGLAPLELERHHLDSIDKSDALVVCDPEGYVGASALIEIGYAQALGLKVVFVEKPEEFMLNTLPAQIGL